MTHPKTNPAARLLAILKDAHNWPTGEPANVVWGRILGCDPQDEIFLLSRLNSLHALWSETVAAVHQHADDENRGLYIRPFEPIRRAISPFNLSAGWDTYRKHLTPDVIVSLEHVADHLRRSGFVDEQKLQGLDEKLSALDKEVAALVDDVQRSAFEEPLRQYLLDGLESIRRAIAEYRIRGSEGLGKALRSNFGDLLYVGSLMRDEEENRGDHESKLKVISRYLAILKDVGDVVQLVLKVPQIITTVTKYLPALPQL